MAREQNVVCYVDTSALIKRYLREKGSDEFDAFCAEPDYDRVICPLQVVEFTSTLQRRVRLGDLDRHQAGRTHRRLLSDLATGGWRNVDFEADVFSRANSLLVDLGAPLSTLDALHLACALQLEAPHFATADRQLAAAARKAKLQVHSF